MLELVARLLGHRNISTQSLQSICYNRFAAAELHHKLANICADLPDRSLTSTGMFKMLTGGDEITAEKKHRDPFKFTNYAKLLFSANKIPETSDDTTAFFRRWIIISCNNYFPPGKANPNILDDICTPEGMSGLLNCALDGLDRLLENKRFSDNLTLEEYREQYLRSSNSALAFLEENLEYAGDPNHYLDKKKLYAVYILWCNALRLPTKRQRELTKQLKQTLPKAQESRPETEEGERVYVWVGIDYTKEFKEKYGKFFEKTEGDQTKL